MFGKLELLQTKKTRSTHVSKLNRIKKWLILNGTYDTKPSVEEVLVLLNGSMYKTWCDFESEKEIYK